MPSIVGGPIKIVSISGGTVLFGDSGFIAPKSPSKSYTGSGSGNTGDFSVSINGISNTATVDADVLDNNTNSGI
ncbi:spore germination protein [Tumebacillus lipolyticus]|uniref:Spore germination protein n=1 Tax=Tumebacillus lipolyticus TaxID=1280370 RepID=A0ABW5A1P9_9BACL